MEIIEKGIRDIETKYEETQQKQKTYLIDTINNTAKLIQNNCSKFDNLIRKYFTDCPEHPETFNIFNPKRVIIIENDKAVKTIENWNTKEGILPNRYVKYNIRCVQTSNKDVGKAFDNITIDKLCSIFNKKYGIDNNKLYDRNGGSVILLLSNRHELANYYIYDLEVDNYLNIYEQTTGVYIMFNKIPFPEFAFHSNHKFNNIYVNFNECLFNNKNINKIHSKDNEKQMLELINHLIPENYEQIYQYFNNTRKLFTQFEVDKDAIISTEDNDIEETDVKDTIITSYKEKLEMYIKENQTIRNKILELEKTFIDKSNKVLELERIIKSKEQEICNINENLEQHKFHQKTEDLNTELLKQKLQILMETDDKLKKELKNYELKYNKIKDSNVGLIEKLKLMKNNISETNEINIKYENEILIHKQQIIEFKDIIKDTENKLNESNKQIEILEKRIITSAENSTDALEIALTEQNKDLQTQIKELKNQINELKKENTKYQNLINKYKSTLQGLL